MKLFRCLSLFCLALISIGGCKSSRTGLASIGSLDVPVVNGEICPSFPIRVNGDCGSDADCSSGVCGRDPFNSIDDGEKVVTECLIASAGLDVGTRCDDSKECARGLCVVAGMCVAPCTQDADCDDNKKCTVVWVRDEEGDTERTHACVPRFDYPEGVTATRQRVNLTTATDGQEALLPGGVGLYFVEPPCGSGAFSFGLRTDKLPSTVLFDVQNVLAGNAPTNGLEPTLAPMGVWVTNGPAMPSSSGYQLLLSAQDEVINQADVTVVRSDTSGGVLDFDLFYVGVPSLTPTGAKGPPIIASALAELETIYAQAGIRIGEVRQHLVSGQTGRFLDRLQAADEDSDDIAKLLQLSSGAPGPSVAVFFVRELDDSEGLLGIAGGLPGPIGLHGTASSGVAIAFDLVDDELGQVLAHEIGHFLGLFHTSETTMEISFNPLTDVPSAFDCFSLDDEMRLIINDTPECRTAANNLMFPVAISDINGSLTTQQSELLSRAPILATN